MKKNLLTLSLLLAGILTAGAQVTKSISGHQPRTAPQQMVRVNAAMPQHNVTTGKELVIYTGTPSKMLNRIIRKADEQVTLEAAYDVPVASYYWGMTAEWSGYSVGILQTSAHVFNKFWNYCSYDENQDVSFTWELPLSSGTIEMDQDEDGNAIDSLKWGYYPAPVLTVKQGGEEATWNLGERGTDNKNGYWYLGTDSLYSLSHAAYAFGLYSGFSNLDKRYETNSDFDGMKVVGFGEYFEKPASATYVASIDLIGWLDESKDINNPLGDNELTAEIYTLDDEGNLSEDPYATAICTSANYQLANEAYGNVGLTFVFTTEDDLFGSVESPIILPNERFMILFKGFENMSGNLIVPFCPAGGFAGHSYVLLEDGSLSTIGYRNYPNTPQVDLHISLNAALATIDMEDPSQKIILPDEGGLAYYEIEDEEGIHHYNNIFVECNVQVNEKNEDQPWQIEESPEWITGVTIDDQYQEDYWVVELFIEGEPLPEGVEGRKGDFIISVYGRELVIPIYQGVVSEENPEKEITDGKYYLANVASVKYWGCGNSWGTQASLVKHPEYVILEKQPDGTYTMETQVSNGGTAYYFEGDYMDNGNAKHLTITKSGIIGYSDDEETQPVYSYTIADGDKCYGYDGKSTVLGKNLSVDDPNALWLIISEEEALEALKETEVEDPNDATFLILDPNFGRNNRNFSIWTGTGFKKGGDNTNQCVESYHADFSMNQLLENVPNGVYSMQVQGFYRQDGEDNDNLPVFYINEEKSTFPLKTGNENSMNDASISFGSGLYTIDPIYVEVKDGTINLGAKLEGNAALWCIWDNFELTYYGADCTIEEAKAAALIEELENLQDRANDLVDQVDNENVKGALEAAIAEAAGISAASGEEAVKAAIAKLADAVDKAEGNVIAKNVIPAMKNLVDATNVYTEEALNEYFTQWNDKYLDGTITKVEASALQNPDVVTGWHAAITVDNFLLSAWDTNPDFNNAPYYINSWSVEGDSDGSNFHVPFFEYWTGDGDSLGERTLTATMEDLKPGNYDVTAWVRVRAKNGYEAPAYGITMQANDGEAVNVAAGQQIGESQFYLDTFTASGTVGSDGVLKIKFNVAADNNISWLSFKNVKFEKAEEPGLADGTYYLKNKGTDKFFAAGHSWGTRSIVNADGLDITIAKAEDGKYTLDTQVFNSAVQHFLGTNLYVDADATGWTIEAVGDGFYTISNEAGYLAVGDNDETVQVAEINDNALWAPITYEERLASVEAPADLTFVIRDANFNRNDHRKDAWEAWSENAEGKENFNISGGNNENNNAESYHAKFSLIQTIEGLPNGVYEMTVQGFCRIDEGDYNAENMPYFFINDQKVAFPEKTGEENSMSDASVSFTAGLYTTSPVRVTVTDGKITLGAKNEENLNLWCIWDNFRLTYLGDTDPDELIVNGNCEGEDGGCLLSKNGDGDGSFIWNPQDGVGVDGSKAAVVHATGAAANEWDAQFFIFAKNHVFTEGEKYKVTMWLKADKDAANSAQAHTTPGNYKHWRIISDGSAIPFTTEWKEFTYEGVIDADLNGIQTIAFNLNTDKTLENNYYFDNISWKLITVEDGIETVKTLVVESNAIYNLRGQKVETPQKGGIYIINGKKVVVK